MIAPGTILAGRFRVVRHVGSGGMASVYLAEDATLGRQVAVKRIHAAPDSELGQRIRREARLGAGLRHPNVVTVFDVIADGEAVLLVMEFVDGETLSDALEGGPLDAARAIAVLRPVASALDDLHARGIVHRDVKPANVLLGARGAVKLTDLGVATSADATQITRTGGVIGTAAYMAPEQFDPGPATGAADVYALAAVAYEVLSGERAYAGATPFEVLGRTRDGELPPDPRELRPELPEGVTDVLRRGMAARPEDRPLTATALVDELEHALGVRPAPAAPAPPARPVEEPTAPPPTPAAAPAAASVRAAPPARRRSKAPMLALLAIAALAGAVAAIVLASGGDDPASDRAQSPARTSARTTGSTSATAPRTEARTTKASAAARPTTPRGAVRAFYELAAQDRFRDAWALAGPRMRAAFGGSFAEFRGTLDSLERIDFRRLDETAREGDRATVALETVATHSDRTERCTGDLRAVRGEGGTWLVEPAGISCART